MHHHGMVRPMRITTWNVNGLRASLRKNFAAHVRDIDPDILLLQEVRAKPGQLKEWAAPDGWHCLWHPAEKKGYSGVAIWSRTAPEILETGLGCADPEGRVLRVRVGWLQVVSLYLPSGSSGEVRQAYKDDFMDQLYDWMKPMVASDEPIVVAGDWNIAPTENDIHNPRGNKNSSGFLPHERAWFQTVLDQGWTDLHRHHVGEQKGPYSWWSNRGRARELDRGWRIDLALGNPAATERLKDASVLRQAGLDSSDHAPVTIELSNRRPTR